MTFKKGNAQWKNRKDLQGKAIVKEIVNRGLRQGPIDKGVQSAIQDDYTQNVLNTVLLEKDIIKILMSYTNPQVFIDYLKELKSDGKNLKKPKYNACTTLFLKCYVNSFNKGSFKEIAQLLEKYTPNKYGSAALIQYNVQNNSINNDNKNDFSALVNKWDDCKNPDETEKVISE